MAWYSFVDDRFRTENLPITKLDFSMFEYRVSDSIILNIILKILNRGFSIVN